MTEPSKFPPDVKAQWTAALRSGQYQQGKGSLHPSLTTFCCLGVLCNVLDPDGWDKESDARQDWTDAQVEEGVGNVEDTSLPTGTVRRLNMPAVIETHLIEMNDDKNKTFAEIADYIDANL